MTKLQVAGRAQAIVPARDAGVGQESRIWGISARSSFRPDRQYFPARHDSRLMTMGHPPAEVGDGTTATRFSPVPLSLAAVTQIAAGSATSAAIRSDGTLLTWGDDNSGGLDASACCRLPVNPVPAPAAGLTFVSQIAFGEMYGLALSTLPAGLVPVPSVIGDTQAQASRDLPAAGLALGTVGSALDPTCDNIGTVLSQRPAAGSYAPRGTHVSITIGKPNPRLCS